MSLLDGIINDLAKEIGKAAATISGKDTIANNTASAELTGPKNGSTSKRIRPDQEMFCFYDKNGRLSYYYLTDYDDQNRITHKAAYNAAGNLVNGFDYEYNEHGDLVWGTWTAYSRADLFRREIKYDEKYRIIDSWNHGDPTKNVVGFRNLNHFDHDDSKVDYFESFNCYEDGTRGRVTIYRHSYNEERTHFTETLIFYEGETEPFAKRGYEYDSDNHRVKEWHESPVGEIVYTDVMRYDSDGKLIDTTRYDKDGKFESVRVGE